MQILCYVGACAMLIAMCDCIAEYVIPLGYVCCFRVGFWAKCSTEGLGYALVPRIHYKSGGRNMPTCKQNRWLNLLHTGVVFLSVLVGFPSLLWGFLLWALLVVFACCTQSLCVLPAGGTHGKMEPLALRPKSYCLSGATVGLSCVQRQL